MCAMTLTAETFGLLNSMFFDYNWVNIALALVIVVNFIIVFINSSKKEYIATYKWSLYAAAFLWLMNPLHVPFIGVFFIIAALLERQIKFPQEIGFSNEGITFNTFPFKSYGWDEVKNALLKDNILTIDFTSNKLIQKETESDVSADIEKEFNAFCNEQLANGSAIMQ